MKRIAGLAAIGVAALIAARLVYITAKIEQQSVRNETQAADLIIVMGAAEYRGRPSPVLKARLDHGLELYLQGLAARIMTTGGAGGDPVFTEGDVGRTYLVKHGVPSEAIIVEPEGASTAYSISAAAEIMRRMDLKSCIVVSDGYHIFRVKRMLEFRGITVYGSPRQEPQRPSVTQWALYLRQAIGYMLWEVGIAF